MTTPCGDRNTYVLTVRYGKERLAELEVGDALFPADPNVELKRTTFGGVLVLCTTLRFSELLNILLAFPPSTLERVVPIITCCDANNNDVDVVGCLVNAVISKKLKYGKVRFGRRGCLSKDQLRLLEKKLREFSAPYSDNSLLVEPLNNVVCIGVVKDDMDKLFKEEVMKIQPYRR